MPHKGYKQTKEHNNKRAKSNLKENVGYHGKHKRMKKVIPKPKFCEECKIISPKDLANKSNKYLLEISDWEWLCRKCHMTKDGRLNKIEKMIKKGYQGFIKENYKLNENGKVEVRN